ncbi:hypothetical protein ABAZ39_29575 (plasmid) [Azospirillum argentinense]|uniref:Uncharacterized protein n=1 Tax=Azospirillum argentinense TaxID=2970906 RepID=A0A060DQ73_9PROT|nr:hypothetical protein [Azospirillum argentinense]AIB16006.1 hypothetical protein ABAZ39_29575 [Azospirillum argentinense]EZQ03723.1 hypothetical protein ABAZ39_28440 [Azospirillum argentinense]
MANLPTARPASASAASDPGTVWVPLPEAMGICAGAECQAFHAPAGGLWAQMRGAWLKARRTG